MAGEQRHEEVEKINVTDLLSSQVVREFRHTFSVNNVAFILLALLCIEGMVWVEKLNSDSCVVIVMILSSSTTHCFHTDLGNVAFSPKAAGMFVFAAFTLQTILFCTSNDVRFISLLQTGHVTPV